MKQVLLSLAIPVLFLGCTSTSSQIRTANGIITHSGTSSAEELHVRLVDFGTRFWVNILSAGQDLESAAETAGARREAVYWKILTLGYARQSLFQKDPLAALVDTWALCMQMRQFFETGAGKDLFGEKTAAVLDAATTVEQDIERIAGDVIPTAIMPEVRGAVATFVRDHPIQLPYTRESMRHRRHHSPMSVPSCQKVIVDVMTASYSPTTER